MSFAAILLLALGLAMDAAAVSATRGLAVERVQARHVLSVALFFGGAQALMPLAGWFAGDWLGSIARGWGDWMAAAVFFVLGAKMLFEALKKRRESASEEAAKPPDAHPFALGTMTLLALATSVDALVAGVTLPIVGAPLALSVITIGATTAVLAIAALLAARKLGSKIDGRLDVVGGLVLIGLGAKVVVGRLLV